jgi:putative tricarboxylic transport membrane protein
MWTVKFFSEGIGLLWLISGVAAVLVGLGIAVRFSRLRAYLGNILIPSFLVALSLVFLLLTFDFPVDEAGPAVIPRLYIAVILVLLGIILLQIFQGKEKAVPRLDSKGFLALLMAIFIVYFLAMPYMGYFLSTFLFIVVMLHILGYRKKVFIWVIAGGWALFSYLLFYKLLYIQLPLGVFEGLF